MTTITANSEVKELERKLAEAKKKQQAESNDDKKKLLAEVLSPSGEIGKAIAMVAERTGLVLGVITSDVSKRGIINIGIKGADEGTAVNINELSKAQKAPGETQAEMRFKNHHKDVKLPKNALHSTYVIETVKFELIGLKGKDNKVVLKDESDEIILMPAADFLASSKKAK